MINIVSLLLSETESTAFCMESKSPELSLATVIIKMHTSYFFAIIAHWTLINKASIIPFVKKIVGNRDYDKNSRRYERC